MSKFRIAITVVLAGCAGLAAYSATSLVAYPEGYRDWLHAKSMVIYPDHSLANPFAGIHHIYANSKALAGLDSGTYAGGATFVFDLLEYEEGEGAGTEGPRKFIGVMEYDAERFTSTGGWGFEAFAGDSKTDRVVDDGGTSCFGCHMAVKDSNYIFTRRRN